MCLFCSVDGSVFVVSPAGRARVSVPVGSWLVVSKRAHVTHRNCGLSAHHTTPEHTHSLIHTRLHSKPPRFAGGTQRARADELYSSIRTLCGSLIPSRTRSPLSLSTLFRPLKLAADLALHLPALCPHHKPLLSSVPPPPPSLSFHSPGLPVLERGLIETGPMLPPRGRAWKGGVPLLLPSGGSVFTTTLGKGQLIWDKF